MPEKTPMTVRIETSLHERLAKEADARMVSLSWLVDRLLAEAVNRLAPVDDLFSTIDQAEPAPKA